MTQCPYCTKPISPGALRCPHCAEDLTKPVAPVKPVRSTKLERAVPPGGGGIGESLARMVDRVSEPPPRVPPRVPTVVESGRIPTRVEEPSGGGGKGKDGGTEGGKVLSFRPILRPPMAKLCILDDGRNTGEWRRVRGDSLVIGRVDGDILIPHDEGVSGRHAEILRRVVGGEFHWYLKDLQSTNGTFVRLSKTRLQNDQEFLIGSRRYAFRGPRQAAAVIGQKRQSENEAASTRGWQAVSPADLLNSLAMLVELTPRGEGRSYPLPDDENWIGSDPAQCNVEIFKDPMCSPKQARVWKDRDGSWYLEDADSKNGAWIRIREKRVTSQVLFQLGEQRFKLRVLS